MIIIQFEWSSVYVQYHYTKETENLWEFFCNFFLIICDPVSKLYSSLVHVPAPRAAAQPANGRSHFEM